MALFSELKRRNVLRVAAAYIAVSWLVIQVIETLFPVFGLSDGAIRAVVILLAIAFVPVVALAWAFELTPEGLMRDSEIDPASPTRRAAGKRLDRVFMIAMALALGYFAVDKFLLDPARDREREQEVAAAAREEGRAEAVREAQDAEAEGPPMVAVLPFVAVGDTEDSTFFATGVHDDLLTQLAQQPSMRVISRTSVLEYKDTEKNIREIGEELRADAILEGGVQSAGERIRINAQLIDAHTDEHLWAETFDRELTASNIFDVQTEIARAIASALHGTLSAQTDTGLIPTTNMVAYRLYHEALAIRDSAPQLFSKDVYRDLLREAAELDPAYTRPQAELVGSLALGSFSGKDQATMVEAEQVLANIATVAPGSTDHLIAQAYYTYYVIADYDLAHEIASRAQELAPSDAHLAQMKSWIERRQGDYGAMVESVRLARQLDPRNRRLTGTIVYNLILDHRYDEARAELATIDAPGFWEKMSGIFLRGVEHRDFGRLAADLQALHEEYERTMPADTLVWARISNREYVLAAELLDQTPDQVEWNHTSMGIPIKTLLELQIRWFLGESDRLEALVREGRASLENRVREGWLSDAQAMLGAGYIAAVQGDTVEAVRLVRGWNREGASRDPPERAFHQDAACQILGMAGAAEEAVACIRTGIAEPSMVAPPFEPYLPHYDSIRDEPVFIELLAELEAKGW
jgi:TolB-like protein